MDWVDKLRREKALPIAKEVARLVCKNFVPGGGIIADAIDGYDQIQVTGLATLDGILDIDLINGFTPVLGDAFDIITFGGVQGAFDAISGSFGFGDGDLYFEVVQQSDRIQLVVAEAPGGDVAYRFEDESVNNALGQIFNDVYLGGFPTQITGSGSLNLGEFVHISGSFTFSYDGLQFADIASGLPADITGLLGWIGSVIPNVPLSTL